MADALGVGFVDILPRSDKFISTLTTQMNTGLAKVRTGLSSTTALTSGLEAGFIGLGAAALIGISKGIAATTEWAAEIRSLQRVTGLAAEDASRLAGAAAILGIPVNSLNIGFGLLAKNIVNSAANLEKYGVVTTDATGATLPFNDILGNVADKFATLQPGAEQAAFAMNVFGRSGKTLIPILQRGREGMEDLEREAERLGLVLSQETLDKAKELSIAQREMGLAFKGAAITIGSDFIPVVTEVTNAFVDLITLVQLIPDPIRKAGLELAIFLGTVSLGTKAVRAITGALAEKTAAQVVDAAATTGSAVAEGEAAAATQSRTFLMGKEVVAIEARNVALAEGIPLMNLASAGTGLMAKAATLLNSSLVAIAAPLYAMFKGFQAARDEWTAFTDGDPVGVANAIADGLKIVGISVPKATDFQSFGQGLDAITAQVATGALDAQTAAQMTLDLADKVGFTLPPALDTVEELAADYQTTADNATAAAESTTDLGLTTEQLNTQLQGILASGPNVSGLFAAMGTSAEQFGKDAVAAATESDEAFQSFVDQTLAQATDAWNSFRQGASDALTFTDEALSKITEDGKVTAGQILNAFQGAAAKTRSFGKDILEVANVGGRAAKDLANSLLESGNVLAAQVIADAPGKMQQQIVDAFGNSETAADKLSTKLTNAIVGPLENIETILNELAKAWGITVNLDDNATPKAKALEVTLKRITGQTYQITTDWVIHRRITGTTAGLGDSGPGFATGGLIPRGFAAGGSTDTIPAMLSPGEFVFKRTAVDRIGVPNLLQMNQGGTVPAISKPQKLDGAMRIYDWRSGLASLDAELSWEDAVRTR